MSHSDKSAPAQSPRVVPLEIFQQQLHSICGSFDIRPTRGVSQVSGGVMSRQSMDLHITTVETDLQQIVRTPRNIRRDNIDDYFLVVQKQGRALMAQGERATVLHPGDMILIDSTKPSEFTFFGDRSRQLFVHVPRTGLERRFGVNIPGGISLNRGDPAAMAIEAIIAKSQSVSDAEMHLQEALFSMIGVVLLERRIGDKSRAVEREQWECSILAQAIGYIEMRYRDPEFRPSMISEDLGLQPHQIQRAFKSLGTTATRYVMAKRLEAARAMLLDKSKSNQRAFASTVAYNSGFSDISYFNRRFREAFGCAPTQAAEAQCA